jgi:hypothetical protein
MDMTDDSCMKTLAVGTVYVTQNGSSEF